jgi:predicted nucleotide-binding protein
MTEDDPEWAIEHVSGQNYEVISLVGYDATDVVMEGTNVAYPRVDFDPKRSTTWQKSFARFEAGASAALTLSPKQSSEPSTFGLTISWTDASGGLHSDWYRIPLPGRTRPDLRPPVPLGFATRAASTGTGVSPRQYAGDVSDPSSKDVFVVHGRNLPARDAMFTFLRALGLTPIEWNKALGQTGSASPYVGQILDKAFAMARAVVVLLTPDDIAHLRREYTGRDDDPDLEPKGQARPNVLFEAGMAFGRHPDRTILVELGDLRPFSDVVGRHSVRLDDSFDKRNDLAQRLLSAGCPVDTSGSDWARAGDFTPPKVPSGPVGRRLPSNTSRNRNHLDARYFGSSRGKGQIKLTNVGSVNVFDLRSPNENEFRGVIDDLEISKLPAGKTITIDTLKVSGAPDTWEYVVTGRTETGEEFTEELFLDLNG